MRYITFFFFHFRRRPWIVKRFYKNLVQKSTFFPDFFRGWQLSIKGKIGKKPRAKIIKWTRDYEPSFQSNFSQVLTNSRRLVTSFGVYIFRFWVYW